MRFDILKSKIVIEAGLSSGAVGEERAEEFIEPLFGLLGLLVVAGFYILDLLGGMVVEDVRGDFLTNERSTETDVAGSLHHCFSEIGGRAYHIADSKGGRDNLREGVDFIHYSERVVEEGRGRFC